MVAERTQTRNKVRKYAKKYIQIDKHLHEFGYKHSCKFSKHTAKSADHNGNESQKVTNTASSYLELDKTEMKKKTSQIYGFVTF